MLGLAYINVMYTCITRQMCKYISFAVCIQALRHIAGIYDLLIDEKQALSHLDRG